MASFHFSSLPLGSPLAALLKSWEMVVQVLTELEDVVYGNEQTIGSQLMALDQEGLAPSFAYAALAAMPTKTGDPKVLHKLQACLASAKARHAVIVQEFGYILNRCQAIGAAPIPIKGCDLAFRIYRESYLRIMSDIDIYFVRLRDAEQLFSELQADGYRVLSVDPSRCFWDWAHHLPTLQSPLTGVHVELHGGLIYPPHDRRWSRVQSLTRHLQAWTWEGMPVTSLGDEANVVYLMAHAFIQRTEARPKLLWLVDSVKILESKKDHFEWRQCLDLAEETDLLKSLRLGIACICHLFHLDLPAEVIRRLRLSGDPLSSGGLEFESPKHPLILAAERIYFSDSLVGGARKLARTFFPSSAYMEAYYSEWQRLPLLVQYAKRLAPWT